MSHRTPIEILKLSGSPNIKRALSYGPPKAKNSLAKKEDLEALWNELAERYKEALADLKENGLMVFQDRSHAGKIFAVRVVNPALKIVQTTERQLVQLAKHLERYPAEPTGSNPKSMTVDELLAASEPN